MLLLFTVVVYCCYLLLLFTVVIYCCYLLLLFTVMQSHQQCSYLQGEARGVVARHVPRGTSGKEQ